MERLFRRRLLFTTVISLVLIAFIRFLPGSFMEASSIGEDSGISDEENIIDDSEKEPNAFTLPYTEIEGVLTFRGDNYRTSPSYGRANMKDFRIRQIWKVKAEAKGIWGGGAGWTGQPAIVKWQEDVKKVMDIDEKYKNDRDFTEVIIGSLNGKVYFIDLKSGEQTRKPIDTGSPIKGSVSIDARGYPLLYVGQGIKEREDFGFRLYSLIDQKQLFLLDGEDEKAPRNWPNFDSSALFSRHEDTLYVGGENGLFYKLKLNTDFNLDERSISINPEIYRFRYERPDEGNSESDSNYGIENSPAAWENLLFFADNGGMIKAIDSELNEIWSLENNDDTDASITLDIEDEKPVLYTGAQVDKQGAQGIIRILKLEGETGKILWEKNYKGYNRDGPSPSNGGLLGTNVIGKHDMKDLVIFSICRTPNIDDGLMLALDKTSGDTVWEWKMPIYSWPSPVDIYDENGKGYIVQTLRNGTICILEGRSGKILGEMKFDSYVEASPAIFNNYMVIGSRNGYIYGFELE